MAPPLVDDSHLIIEPVFPVSVNVPLLLFAQVVVTAGVSVPPAELGVTLIEPGIEVFPQGPVVVTV